MLKKIGAIFLLLSAGVLGLFFSVKTHPTAIMHVESLRTYHYPASFVQSIQGDAHAGEKIYQQYCVACHAPNPVIDVHAPPRGNQAIWNALSQSLGEEQLWQFTLDGHNAMPARGGCFECSDEQLRQAMLYLREKK